MHAVCQSISGFTQLRPQVVTFQLTPLPHGQKGMFSFLLTKLFLLTKGNFIFYNMSRRIRGSFRIK